MEPASGQLLHHVVAHPLTCQVRMINEKLYKTSSSEAHAMMQEDQTGTFRVNPPFSSLKYLLV